MKNNIHDDPTKSNNATNRGAVILSAVLIICGSLLVSHSKALLLKYETRHAEQIERPPLYLPSASYVKLVSMGFNNFLSDILWFNTINYFGKQLRGKRDYRWLSQMCDLVTRLDNKQPAAYEFCSTMIAWEAKDFESSTALLTRAIQSEPTKWRYWYLRGFNYWYFHDKKDLAKRDLEHASRIPNAPTFLASLASRLMVNSNEVDTAIGFLQDLLKNSNDENAKASLKIKLKKAYMARDIRLLRDKIKQFSDQTGLIPVDLADLVNANLLTALPHDPFGGTYYIDKQTGEIKSSSGETPLEFHGKTKDSGIFSQENS